MAVVTVYQRHSKKCRKHREEKTGQNKRCRCRFWLRWGKDGKRSAKTRSLEIATKAARKLEQELEFEALGIEAPKKPDHTTIEAAIKLYLDDMAQRGVILDTKYLNLFRERAFHRAVSAMLPELPDFHLRQTNTFSTQTADAVSEFTHYSAALDPTHTPEKSMEMVGKEAYTLAAKLIEKDMGFKEEASIGNYEWVVAVGNLPATGWEVKEAPDLSIYDWNTGVAVQRYALMRDGEDGYLDPIPMAVEHERRAVRHLRGCCEFPNRRQARDR